MFVVNYFIMRLVLLLITLLCITANAQNTYTVDNKPGAPADFSNLQDAIDTVPAGSTLLVQGSPTTYTSGDAQNPRSNSIIEIDKEMHIIGAGYFLDQNPNTQAYQTSTVLYTTRFEQGSDGSSISGVDIRNSIPTSHILIYDSQNINVSNTKLGHNGEIRIYNSNNIYVSNSYNADIYVQDNLSSHITLNSSLGRIYDGDPSTFTITNCIYPVLRAGMTAYNNIVNSSSFISGDPNIHHNVVRNSNSTNTSYIDANNNKYIFCSSGECGNLFIDSSNPQHTSDGRYMLGAGSLALGAGVNGADCGMFGGGYRLSGIPNIPNIYEFTVPDTGYTNDGGIPITIKVNSNN